VGLTLLAPICKIPLMLSLTLSFQLLPLLKLSGQSPILLLLSCILLGE
jgi:hypothetical protein